VNTNWQSIRVAVIFLAVVMGVGSAGGVLSEPDHIIYGHLTWHGEPIVAGQIVGLTLDGQEHPVCSYVYGSDGDLGEMYALRVPMDALDDRFPGRARPGDDATITVDGEIAAMVKVGDRGTVRLLDVDPDELEAQPSLTIDDVALVESDSGTVEFLFTVTLSPTSEDQVEVSWVTEDGTAIGGGACGAGIDYVAMAGDVIIAPGDQSQTVTVLVCGEIDEESDETFYVNLVEPALNAVILDPQGKGTIVDDDTPPQLMVNNITIPEPDTGETVGSFRVSLSKTWDQDVSFDYATSDGTATVGADYSFTSGTEQIVAGALEVAIPVSVLADVLNEDDEIFFLDISAPVNASILDPQGQATIIDSAQFLVWVEAQIDGVGGVDGLAGAAGLAVSPDGAHVYVTGRADNAVTLFARAAGGGELTMVEAYTPEDFTNTQHATFVGLGGAADVLISADGEHVYVAAETDDAVSVFARDPVDGRLTLIEVEINGVNDLTDTGPEVHGIDGATALASSPQDPLIEHLYVAGYADHSVAVFKRISDPVDPAFGSLSFVESETNGVDDPADLGGTVVGLQSPTDIVVSPDGEHVYVTGQGADAVVLFDRDATGTPPLNQPTGKLSFMEHEQDGASGVDGIAGAAALALTADGTNLYVAGFNDNAIAVFERIGDDLSADFGRLDPIGEVRNGVNGVDGLVGASGVAVSADDGYVYGTGYLSSGLAVFERGTAGALTFLEVKADGVGGVDGLFGANAIAVASDDGNVYATGTQDNAVAVFARDLTDPSDPTLWSTTHSPPMNWHNAPIITMAWSGAADTGGSGLAGYSFHFDTTPGSDADPVIDMAHGQDDHTTSSSALPDDIEHYFHLRTCDHSQNCSATIHAGPYWIDSLPPPTPTTVSSISHVVGVPSFDETIEMQWVAPVDPGIHPSGVIGYSYTFSEVSAGQCNFELDLTVPTGTVTSDPLAAGNWYFHICAVDAAGNWGPPAVAGPYEIIDNTIPPKVIDARTVAEPTIPPISLGDTAHHGISQLLLAFSKDMYQSFDPVDPYYTNRVTNTDNYRLVTPGPDQLFQTTDCLETAGDDTLLSIDGVEYFSTVTTVALSVGGDLTLPIGWYRLMACGSTTLHDINHNIFDGDGDGVGGDDFSHSFLMERTNVLLKANFTDTTVTPEWGMNHPAIGWDSDTADFAADPADLPLQDTSGSMMVARETGVGHPHDFAITQCVHGLPGTGGSPWHLSGMVRINELLGGDPGEAGAFGEVVFYDTAGCQGAAVGNAVTNTVYDDTQGDWLPITAAAGPAPPTAVSAAVSFQVRIPPTEDFSFDAWFDNLVFQYTDTIPPTGVVALSTSHGTGVWTSLEVIDIQWSGGTDAGTGIEGYSYLFDDQPATQPDDLLEVLHDGGVQTVSSDPLSDGPWYFHLRTCDWVGTCSDTHIGPFLIDSGAPANPTDLVSTSHVIGVDSNDSVIVMSWTPAVDIPPGLSGVAGYAYAFEPGAGWTCNPAATLQGGATGVSSSPLANGSYFFHICTVDAVGNWSSAATIGPYTIADSVPPTVMWISSVAAPLGAGFPAGGFMVQGPTQLLVTFSEPVYDPVGDTDLDDVTNPNNTQIVSAGANGILETADCLSVQGDDTRLAMDWVAYDLASRTAAAKPAGSLALTTDLYGLFVCGSTSITDHAGNSLDGDGNGIGGDDFALWFVIAGDNLLDNPNFDDGLDSWTTVTVPPSEFTAASDDAGGAFSSGSAALTNLSGADQTHSLSQCVDVAAIAYPGLSLGGKARLVNTGIADPSAFAEVAYYDGAGCTGAVVGSDGPFAVVGDTGGWVPIGPNRIPLPEPAVSARVTFSLQSGTDPSAEFDGNLDDLYFGTDLTAIFEDGFETGDLSRWAVTP
jgi:DNA-binding beta-propeller fold protein YncE